MLPAESLMEYVILDFLPRKWRMVSWQNTLFAKKHGTSWIFVLPKLLLVAPQCTGIANQMMICPVARSYKASFFAQIAFLTAWFHQGDLFSLSPATLSCLCPQLSAADEVIADLNCSLSFLMQ